MRSRSRPTRSRRLPSCAFAELAASGPRAAVAERVPGRATLPARAAAAQFAVAHLHGEPAYDALRGGLLERRCLLDRDPADARVLEREPPQDRGRPPRLLGLVERRVPESRRVEQELEQMPLVAVARDGKREHAEDLGAVRVDRRVDELPRVLEPQAPPPLAEVPLDHRQASADWLERFDREPVLVRPVARRDAVPCGERRVQIAWILDAEVAEARADARLVHDPIADVALRQRDGRRERVLDELRVGAPPREADEDADVPTLDEPEPPGAA